MTHYDDRRSRTIETPAGPVMVDEKRWNEGDEDDHWAYVQNLKTSFHEDVEDGVIVADLLKEAHLAGALVNQGYEYHSMLEQGVILWVKYV